MRAALYARVSTDEQARDGVSLAAQEQALRAYCASQGWDVAGAYIDDGYSGKSLDRPAVQRLIADAEARRIDVVLVWRIDRLSRRLIDVLRVIEDVLTPHDVGLRSVTEAFDTTTPAGRAMLAMLGTFSQLERETIVERIRAATRYRADQGLWHGVAPWGTRYGPDGALEPDPDALPHLRRMFDLVASGESVQSVIRHLEDAGAPPPFGRDHFARSTVQRMIRNRAYIGERGWRRARHDPIIDPALWERANAAMDSHVSHRTGSHPQHLLTGILRCPRCGHSMAWKPQLARHSPRRRRDYYYYTCTNGNGCCRVRAEVAEAAFLRAFLAYDRPPAAPTQEDAMPGPSERIAEIDAALDRLVSAVEHGTLTPDLVRKRLAALQSERVSLTRTANRHTSPAEPPLFREVRDAWPHMTLDERRQAILAVVESATITKVGGLTIVWR